MIDFLMRKSNNTEKSFFHVMKSDRVSICGVFCTGQRAEVLEVRGRELCVRCVKEFKRERLYTARKRLYSVPKEGEKDESPRIPVTCENDRS